MSANPHLFGIEHIAIMASVPAFSALLTVAYRRRPQSAQALRYLLLALLLGSWLPYYGSFFLDGAQMFPGHLPLELCDISMMMTIVYLLTRSQAIFDLVYYYGIAGASMSLLTPNLMEPSVFLSVQYFADHGLIVVALLFLVWTGQVRPRPGSLVRAMVGVNLIAAVVGAFDFVFKQDYMFLGAKPQALTLLNFLGPWPWYIVSCEGVALALFGLLYLPFRRSGAVKEARLA